MKRVLLVVPVLVCASTPASSQFAGMPVWNSPKGGTGITISGDYGKPNADWGKGNAFGARGTLGLGSLSATLGFASWNPSGTAPTVKSVGGDAAFRSRFKNQAPHAVLLDVQLGPEDGLDFAVWIRRESMWCTTASGNSAVLYPTASR